MQKDSDHLAVAVVEPTPQAQPSPSCEQSAIGAPRRKSFLRKFVQWLCGKITGHRPGKDWGWGFGDTADAWCKYCDKMCSIPKADLKKYEGARKQIYEMTGKDIRRD